MMNEVEKIRGLEVKKAKSVLISAGDSDSKPMVKMEAKIDLDENMLIDNISKKMIGTASTQSIKISA